MARRAAVIALAAPARPAWAHAEQISSEPTADVVLEASPEVIVVRFSEAIEPVDDSLRLLASTGEAIEIGRPDTSGGANTLSAAVPATLPPGSYVVGWRALSADSHVIRGAFVFSVGSASSGATEVVGELLREQRPDSSAQWWLGLGRWLSYAGLAVAIGGLFGLSRWAPDLVATRKASIALISAAAAGVVGTVVMIGAQATQIGGSILDLADVADTASGRWWLIRVAVASGTLLAMVNRGRVPAAVRSTPAAALLTIGSWFVVAGGGHSVSGRFIPLAMVSTTVHLTAMSIWIGGVTMVAVVVPPGRRRAAAVSFSPWALGSVAALAVSGTINGVRQLDRLASLFDSAYGRWLLAKLVIVGAVLTVAGVVGRALRPTFINTRTDMAKDTPAVSRLLRFELAGAAAILVTTVGLVGAPPPWSRSAETRSTTAIQGDRFAQIDLEPAITGATTLHVTIISPRGSFDRADEIEVRAELPSAQLGPIDIPVAVAGANHVTTNRAALPVPGRWRFIVTARYGDFDEVVFVGELDVDAP